MKTNNQDLEFTSEIDKETQSIYEKVKTTIPKMEWMLHAPYISAINRLKKEKNAIILAHNYQTPEIYHGVADFAGDSLALARLAAETDADIIVLCGVHFMAETAKILNPNKMVLIPDMEAGCSLAESITGADVRLLKERYPGVPVVTYVNTSVDVKAETDVCCTSGNAVKVVESLGVDRVLCIPDEYLAQYIATQTKVEIITWKGHCEVHERFTAQELRDYRKKHTGIQILAHPECPPEVLAEADFVGSTKGLIDYVDNHRPQKVVMITECSMSDNITSHFPEVEFVRPCNLCPHMKRITLPKILDVLTHLSNEVVVDEELGKRARQSVERMLAIG